MYTLGLDVLLKFQLPHQSGGFDSTAGGVQIFGWGLSLPPKDVSLLRQNVN